MLSIAELLKRLNLADKTKEELKKTADNIKTSDLAVEQKAELLEEVEYYLNGSRYNKDEVLKDIEDGQADIDDLN